MGENNPGDANDDKVDKLIDIVKQQLEAQMLLLKSLATCKCRVCDKDVETEESINKHPGSSQQSQSGRRKGNILEETSTISSRTKLAAEQDPKSDPVQILPDLPQAYGEVTPIKMFHNSISDELNQEISISASAQDMEHFTVTELSELENELEKSPNDDVLRIEYDMNRSSPQNIGKSLSLRQGRRDNSTSPRRKIQKSTTNNFKVKKSTGSRTKVKKTTMLHSNLGQVSDLTTVKPKKNACP